MTRAGGFRSAVYELPLEEVPALAALLVFARFHSSNADLVRRLETRLDDIEATARALAIPQTEHRSERLEQRKGHKAGTLARLAVAPSDNLDVVMVATTLGVSERRVRELAGSARLPARRVGGRWLFDAADIEAAAERRRRFGRWA